MPLFLMSMLAVEACAVVAAVCVGVARLVF